MRMLLDSMDEPVELLFGCYEQILFGYRVTPGEKQWTATADFTNHSHTASVSVIAVNNRFVATGSKDETIQIYDMKKKVEHGALLHHNGSITCLEFFGNTHLLSGAEDGLMCVWNTKKWECQQTFKAHKGHVLSLSIHPSGKLALSVGTDKTLRTWNLVEGRSAFIKNIKQNAHIVQWSPSGEKYVVVIQDKMDVYEVETASVIGTIKNPKRISSIRFITVSRSRGIMFLLAECQVSLRSLTGKKDTLLAVAGDDDLIRLYNPDSQKCLCEFKAHETRVKSLYSFEYKGSHIIVSSSSDGYVKMWRLDLTKLNAAPTLLSEVSTSARLTCLSVWHPGVSESNVEKSSPEAPCEKESECPKKKRKVPKEQTEKTSTEQQSEDQVVCKKRKLTDKQKLKKKQNKD